MTLSGDQEICPVSGRLPHNPGKLAKLNIGHSFFYHKVERFTSLGSFATVKPTKAVVYKLRNKSWNWLQLNLILTTRKIIER